MGFGNRLIHQVVIERFVVQLDGSNNPVVDDYAQPVGDWTTLRQVAALVQPKNADEVAAVSQAGAPLSDHTIYMFPTDVTNGDRIRFATDTDELPYFNVVGVRDAAGIAHHFEIDSKLVGTRHYAGS